jgi:hypothetical protein
MATFGSFGARLPSLVEAKRLRLRAGFVDVRGIVVGV